ncbi:MarR family transcriptional regulator [bacterium]|nr:MarR family transcriptional regulator [bacterium]
MRKYQYIIHTMNDYYGINSPHIEQGIRQLQKVTEELSELYIRIQYNRSNRLGLTAAEAKCLLCFNREKYLTVKGISGCLNLVKSRISRLIDGLENKMLVQRTPDPNDKRICLISLTVKGERVLHDLQKCCYENFARILKDIPPERWNIVMNSLREFRAALQNEMTGMELIRES